MRQGAQSHWLIRVLSNYWCFHWDGLDKMSDEVNCVPYTCYQVFAG
jgi:hypothetical protein